MQLRNQQIMPYCNNGTSLDIRYFLDFSLQRTGQKLHKMETEIHQTTLVWHLLFSYARDTLSSI